jgi:hypothetical protein
MLPPEQVFALEDVCIRLLLAMLSSSSSSLKAESAATPALDTVGGGRRSTDALRNNSDLVTKESEAIVLDTALDFIIFMAPESSDDGGKSKSLFSSSLSTAAQGASWAPPVLNN